MKRRVGRPNSEVGELSGRIAIRLPQECVDALKKMPNHSKWLRKVIIEALGKLEEKENAQ